MYPKPQYSVVLWRWLPCHFRFGEYVSRLLLLTCCSSCWCADGASLSLACIKNMCRHVVSHRWQEEVVLIGMVPKPISGTPSNCRWCTFHVLCTSAKLKVFDRVERISSSLASSGIQSCSRHCDGSLRAKTRSHRYPAPLCRRPTLLPVRAGASRLHRSRVLCLGATKWHPGRCRWRAGAQEVRCQRIRATRNDQHPSLCAARVLLTARMRPR